MWGKRPLSSFSFSVVSCTTFSPTFSFICLSHSLPSLCDVAQGEQKCNVKALTTECMDTHTAERDVHVWNEISAQSVGVAAIKHIKPYSFKVATWKKSHKSLHGVIVKLLQSSNNCVWVFYVFFTDKPKKSWSRTERASTNPKCCRDSIDLFSLAACDLATRYKIFKQLLITTLF